MNDKGPVSLLQWETSYQHTLVLYQSELCFVQNLSGSHRIKANQLILEGQGSFAFLVRGPGEFTFSGSGLSRCLTSHPALIANILHSGYGSRLSAFLTPLERSFLCFRPHGEDHQFISRIYQNLKGEIEENRQDRDQILEFHLLELLLYLRSLRSLTPNEVKKISTTSFVWSMEEMVCFVKQNYDGAYTLDDLAARCALNSSYFSRAFKEYTGIPLFEFINRLRIEKACQLLKSSDLSILEIAFSVGYNNISFFNRYFKRIHLISPGEYRRRIRT